MNSLNEGCVLFTFSDLIFFRLWSGQPSMKPPSFRNRGSIGRLESSNYLWQLPRRRDEARTTNDATSRHSHLYCHGQGHGRINVFCISEFFRLLLCLRFRKNHNSATESAKIQSDRDMLTRSHLSSTPRNQLLHSAKGSIGQHAEEIDCMRNAWEAITSSIFTFLGRSLASTR